MIPQRRGNLHEIKFGQKILKTTPQHTEITQHNTWQESPMQIELLGHIGTSRSINILVKKGSPAAKCNKQISLKIPLLAGFSYMLAARHSLTNKFNGHKHAKKIENHRWFFNEQEIFKKSNLDRQSMNILVKRELRSQA